MPSLEHSYLPLTTTIDSSLSLSSDIKMFSLIKQPLKGLKIIGTNKSRSRKKTSIPEVVVYVPTLWIPSQTDLQTDLKPFIPQHLIHRLLALRTRIINLAAQHTQGSANNDLKRVLEEYLFVFLGFAKRDKYLHKSVDFSWTSPEAGKYETCIPNSRFELLCVIYMLAVLTLSEANEKLIPKDYPAGLSQKTVSLDSQRDAIDLLLKAAGYLDFCVKNIVAPLPPSVKEKLPAELQEGVLEALKIQSLGQGTELQLGLAVESQTATLSVKRRLACEALVFFSQAHFSLLGCNLNVGNLKKHLSFIRWKYLELKAAAYYYHGLMIDKGFEPQSRMTAVSCFLAAKENLSDSKKTCLSFSLASPVTRPTPPWGIMKHLHLRILDIASKKLKAHDYLLRKQKGLLSLPDLPQFHLTLIPEDYELPRSDPAWNKENLELPKHPVEERHRKLTRTDSHAIVPCIL